jgi:hypothetical protein
MTVELRQELARVDRAGLACVLVEGYLEASDMRSERGLRFDRVPPPSKAKRGSALLHRGRRSDQEAMMSTLELSPEEFRLLREILTSYLGELRVEISRTDTRDFRDNLKEREAVVRRLIDRLAGAHGATEA